MKHLFLLLIIFLTFSCGDDRRSNFTTLNEDGDIILSEQSEKILDEIIEGYYTCNEEAESKRDCRYYVAEAICKFYDIDDFKEKDGSFMTYEDMISNIKMLSQWSIIGKASSQKVLDKAMAHANDGRPTIAMEADKNTGHIALILPGEKKKSGSWQLECPNSASFFRHKVEAYVNKPLSYSYRSPENIVIYSRD